MFPFFIISENCVLYSPFQETRENSIVVVNRLHILYIKKDICIISLHIARKNSQLMRKIVQQCGIILHYVQPLILSVLPHCRLKIQTKTALQRGSHYERTFCIYSLRKYTGISLYISLTPPPPYKKQPKCLKKPTLCLNVYFFKLINHSSS